MCTPEPVTGAWQGNQCKKFLGLGQKKDGKTWRDVIDTLKQLVRTSDLDKKNDVITFLDDICIPLISKLVEVVRESCSSLSRACLELILGNEPKQQIRFEKSTTTFPTAMMMSGV